MPHRLSEVRQAQQGKQAATRQMPHRLSQVRQEQQARAAATLPVPPQPSQVQLEQQDKQAATLLQLVQARHSVICRLILLNIAGKELHNCILRSCIFLYVNYLRSYI